MVEKILKEWCEIAGDPVDAAPVLAALERFQDETGYKVNVFGQDHSSRGVAPRQLLDLHALELRNFKNTSKRRVEIKPGVTMFKGPNDAGKSSWLQSLRYNARGAGALGNVPPERLIRLGEKKMLVTGEYTGIRISRGVSIRKISRGAKAGQEELEHELSVEAEGSKDSTPKKAQALIDAWLGADAEFILNTCFITQGDLTMFLDQRPAVRRELIYKMMALDSCEEAAKRIRAWVDSLVQANVALANDAAKLLAERDSLLKQRNEIPLAVLKEKLAKLEGLQDPAAARAAQRAQLAGEAGLLEAQEKGLAGQVKQRGELTAKLDELRKAPELAAEIVDMGPQLATAELNLSRATALLDEATAACNELIGQGKAIAALPAQCPVCAAVGKACEITPELKEAQRKAKLEEWKTSNKARLSAEVARGQARADLDRVGIMKEEADKVARVKANVLEQIALLEPMLAQIPDDVLLKHNTVTQSLMLKRGELEAFDKQGATLTKDEKPELRQQIARAEAFDEQIRNVDAKRKKASEPTDTTAALQLAKAFAKDGIPLMMAARHTGRINEIAAEIVKNSGERYTYRFSQELEPELVSPAGAVHPLLGSQSARERGALVLVSALGRYMQELLNVQVPVLWIDELAYQDDANTEVVVALIRNLTAWYPKVIFAASQWDRFEGLFDYEIALNPEKLATDLADVRQTAAPVEVKREPIFAGPPVNPNAGATVESLEAEDVAENGPASAPPPPMSPIIEQAVAAADARKGELSLDELAGQLDQPPAEKEEEFPF